MDRRNVGKVRGYRQSHWEVERRHGQRGDEVSLDVGDLVLGHPGEAGNVVGQIPGKVSRRPDIIGVARLHQGRVLEASLLSKPAAVSHLLRPYPPLEPTLPVLMADDVGDGIVEHRDCGS